MKSLFMRMGYVRRKNASSKIEILDKARKEIEYQFHFNIVSKVEKYNIPDAFIINLDQTTSYLFPCKKIHDGTKRQYQCSNTWMRRQENHHCYVRHYLSWRISPYSTHLWWQNASKSTQITVPKFLFAERE